MTTVTTTDQVTALTVSANEVAVTSGADAVTVTTTANTTTVTSAADTATVTTVAVPSVVTASDPQTTTVTSSLGSVVTTTVPQVSVVTVATQGPSAQDLSMQYRQLVDFVNDTPVAGQTTIYKGWSIPGGGATSVAVWKVQKLVLNAEDDITSSGFAPGAVFDQVWDDRLSLVYS